jgi:endonuclease III
MDISYYKRFNELIDKYIDHSMDDDEQIEYEQLCQLILSKHFSDQRSTKVHDNIPSFSHFQ